MSRLVSGQRPKQVRPRLEAWSKVQGPRSKVGKSVESSTLDFGHWTLDLAFVVALFAAAPALAGDAGDAKHEPAMKAYKQLIAGTDIDFDMVPIPGGEFTMGSPKSEKGHKPDEEPQHRVKI